MRIQTTFLKAVTVSVAMLGGTAVIATVAAPDLAWAGNGKGGGAEKSRSGGNGAKNRGNSRNSGTEKTNRGNSKASNSSRQGGTKSTRTPRPPKASNSGNGAGNKLARTLGVHPSQLGALNAANASPNALKNASPNSRVGLINIYAQEVGVTNGIAALLSEAQERLNTIETPERTAGEITEAIVIAGDQMTTLQSELSALEAQLEAAGGSDATIEADIDTKIADIVDKDAEITALAQERADAEAYATAEQDVIDLEGTLETQSATQRQALINAANKEVTDEVESAVQALLGLNQ